MTLWQGAGLLATATTAADGTYSFTGLAPGIYTVRAAPASVLRYATTPDHFMLALFGGERIEINFGAWNGWPGYLPLIVR